ncbi:enoyl-CoA hydratase/isomerase family protein [Stakelama sp. CBK3Z-3]|uniref:Enoyl-CoA hydratase/isomerase family protein n=1 Tax=Stakelama flava TaxID=2860338 RepID=A0ABS6XQ28_9SPHN|nr:enoyl-CoA hydratase/isomerase family protein [Stakelama flava]MBW4332324.1 enoyl-CoA hydratase/isomerase family protein [Stakelama flava]
MSASQAPGDIVTERNNTLAIIRLCRPPHNFFDLAMIQAIADAVERNDADEGVRVTILEAEGRNFCAGADFTRPLPAGEGPKAVYDQAARIFGRRKPMVASIDGAAVGGGLGLALAADFRILGERARLHANFSAIGLYPGFALTATLPALIGAQSTADLLLSSRRVLGEEAVSLGLADRLVPSDQLSDAARNFGRSIAQNAPLSLLAIRAELPLVREADARKAMAREVQCQTDLMATADFREGVRAAAERRTPAFIGA